MNGARVLLTYLREGDYAHAGDRQAVDLVMQKALELSREVLDGCCLDVGSGFGGTADYIRRLGFNSVYGIDIDEASVEYAKKRYPEVHFSVADVRQITKTFEARFFSFISLFNVLYAIEDKSLVLRNLAMLAKPGAILTLFDYTAKQAFEPMKDLSGKPMYPIVVSDVKETLQKTGWEVVEVVDLSFHFLSWYEDLLNKMQSEESELVLRFSKQDIAKVKTTFDVIYERLSADTLGGIVIYAKRSEKKMRMP